MANVRGRRPVATDRGLHQNIARTTLVLSALAAAGKRGLRLTDVTQLTGISKTAAHRCLAGLTLHGLASFEENGGHFFLGDKIFAWGVVARGRFELADRATPYLERLADETEDTIYFMLRRADDAVCYGRAEGRFPIKTLTLNVGEKRPLGVNTGTLAIMAFLDDEEVDRLIRTRAAARSNYPIKDVALRKMIIRARACGHSRIDGEIMPGMSGVGVPVRNSRGFPVAALSVAAISARLEEPRRSQIAHRLKQEAKRMQEELADLL